MELRRELEYYLEREVTSDDIQEADEWLSRNPGGDLSEWASAIKELDA